MIAVMADVLGVGVALVAPALAVIWYAVNLRSNVLDRYADLIPLTEAGLEELAAEELRALASQIDLVLGFPAEVQASWSGAAGSFARMVRSLGAAEFDPEQALASPDRIRKQLARVDAVLSARTRIGKSFGRLCRLGPILAAVGVLYVGAAALAILYYSEVTRWRGVGVGAVFAAAVLVSIAAIVGIVYFIDTARIDRARLMLLPNRDNK